MSILAHGVLLVEHEPLFTLKEHPTLTSLSHIVRYPFSLQLYHDVKHKLCIVLVVQNKVCDTVVKLEPDMFDGVLSLVISYVYKRKNNTLTVCSVYLYPHESDDVQKLTLQ